MEHEILGKIHSFQSMGAVDGPGLRCVVFMQGCPLRCAYCHNPDTWDFSQGTQHTPQELVEKILRFKPFIANGGGVTVTGGEPLMQPEFVARLFQLLHREGLHTALDTSGFGDLAKAAQVLEHTDLVLADLKFCSPQEYRQYCGGELSQALAFLELTARKSIPLWVRHVVVPGLTDSRENIQNLASLAARYPNLKKIELLPFRKLCLEKYQAMGIPFPLEYTPEMPEAAMEELNRMVQKTCGLL